MDVDELCIIFGLLVLHYALVSVHYTIDVCVYFLYGPGLSIIALIANLLLGHEAMVIAPVAFDHLSSFGR